MPGRPRAHVHRRRRRTSRPTARSSPSASTACPGRRDSPARPDHAPSTPSRASTAQAITAADGELVAVGDALLPAPPRGHRPRRARSRRRRRRRRSAGRPPARLTRSCQGSLGSLTVRIDEILAAATTAGLLLRVLPAQDAGGRGEPLRGDRAAAPARARLRLGDLRRGRHDPRQDASRSSRASATTTGSRRWRTSPASARRSSELRATLDDDGATSGFDNVLALRGDPPPGQEEWTKTEGGLEYSRELVELIRADYGSRSARPASPRRTSTPPAPRTTCATCKAKVDAGVGLPHHAAVLRQRRVLRLRRARPGDRHRGRRSSRASCRSRTSPSSSASPRCAGRRCPTALLDELDARARPARGGARLRRRLRDAAVRRAAGRRRARHPLLHAEPLARRRARSSARSSCCAPGSRRWQRRRARVGSRRLLGHSAG